MELLLSIRSDHTPQHTTAPSRGGLGGGQGGLGGGGGGEGGGMCEGARKLRAEMVARLLAAQSPAAISVLIEPK